MKNEKLITIDLLKNHPKAIPILTKIWHEVLGKIWLADVIIEDLQKELYAYLNENSLPMTFVAFFNNEPVGMCSLCEEDGVRQDLKPWLCDLVVCSDFQKQGIGRQLINAVKEKAYQMNFSELHLFAFDAAISEYYKNLGWEKIGMDKFKNYPVTIMKIKL